MSKSTLLIVLASLAEVGWVIGLKHSTNVLEWGLTVVCIAVSFGLLIKVSETNAVSTSYALFVGLGTLGTVLSSVFFRRTNDSIKSRTISDINDRCCGIEININRKIGRMCY